MRYLKLVLGVGCFVLAILPGSLAFLGFQFWTAQRQSPIFCFASILAALAISLVCTGWFLIARRGSTISRKAKALIVLPLGIGIFTLVVFPNFIRARSVSSANPCLNNLRQIDAAKQEWALENGKTNGVVTANQLTNYLYDGIMPKCPSGGEYTIGKIGEPPTCSLGTTVNPPHVLP
jgi:ABC-type transport system involved in multi-copper enzyme maturation permease subunit